MTQHFSAGWDVEIIPYTPQYRVDFERITRDWFKEYHFPVEPIDELLFRDPERYVLAPGGGIFFARCCDEIVGTCGVLKHTVHEWELIKLGVKRAFRGMKVGQRLVEAALAYARSAGAQRIVLYTNSRLLAAYFLYRKLGFRERPFPQGTRYEKANSFMVLEY
jgi:ribosomal protein S18 acetylase RimI-like enzyme